MCTHLCAPSSHEETKKPDTYSASLFTHTHKTHTSERCVKQFWRCSGSHIVCKPYEKTKVNKATVHLSVLSDFPNLSVAFIFKPTAAYWSHEMSQKDTISFLKRHRDFLCAAGALWFLASISQAGENTSWGTIFNCKINTCLVLWWVFTAAGWCTSSQKRQERPGNEDAGHPPQLCGSSVCF